MFLLGSEFCVVFLLEAEFCIVFLLGAENEVDVRDRVCDQIILDPALL